MRIRLLNTGKSRRRIVSVCLKFSENWREATTQVTCFSTTELHQDAESRLRDLSRFVTPAKTDSDANLTDNGLIDRKVLCDRTLPTCRRCASSSRDCKGYDLRLSWPRAGDKKRALVGPDTPETNSLANIAKLPFVNASFWDVEMHHDRLFSESKYRLALAQRNSHATRLHRMRQLAQPVLNPPVSWMPPNLSDLDKDLLQYCENYACSANMAIS